MCGAKANVASMVISQVLMVYKFTVLRLRMGLVFYRMSLLLAQDGLEWILVGVGRPWVGQEQGWMY